MARFRNASLLMLVLALAGQPVVEARTKRSRCAPEFEFTHLATLLLDSELGLTFGRLQIYPVNEYTPPVHRILQVCANLHEAARPLSSDPDNALPTVFKPVFAREGEVIWLAGYEEVDAVEGDTLSAPLDLDDPGQRASLGPRSNVLGVPWLIGVRKGLPNFNELALETIIEISRPMQLGKATAMGPPTCTNQTYLLSLRSGVGVEAWNAYRAAFERPVDVMATNELELRLTLTQQPGGQGATHHWPKRVDQRVNMDTWPGTGAGPTPQAASFLPVLVTNLNWMTNVALRADGRLETDVAELFPESERNLFPVPEMTLAVTSRFQFVTVDRASGRVLDYVQLRVGGETNLTQQLALMSSSGRLGGGAAMGGLRYVWDTQRMGGEDDIHAPTRGALVQIVESMNLFNGASTAWRDAGGFGTTSVRDEITHFIYFMAGLDRSNTVMRVPFTPVARFRLQQHWQANDPMVHHTAADLAMTPTGGTVVWLPLSMQGPQLLETIGRLNQRYAPWGGNPAAGSTASGAPLRYNLAFKDPLVFRADDWNFPEGGLLTPLDLGRVHRGTPWQTLYLKSEVLPVGPGGGALLHWSQWTGVYERDEAARMLPHADWRLVGTLIQTLWPEKPNKLLSVNDPRTQQWLKALDGIAVLTNTTPDSVFLSNPFAVAVLEPRVMTRKSEQAALMLDAINRQRNRVPWPGGRFEHFSDVIGTPALSMISPWLNTTAIQAQRGISDEAYEAVPLQLLARLRSDSVGKPGLRHGRPCFHFTGHPGARYVVETSTDMVHWTAVSEHVASHGGFVCEWEPQPGDHARFFRSRLVDDAPPPGKPHNLSKPDSAHRN